ncbi:creatininase family protein [Paractinoplanes atraurantiacus]|uniref:Creatinine amidohydrolase n=1 Tax=Paractinoplanes atraurantiacus TaxID=1036182 RepID=A0A285JQ96_9ACTN|nr:creatininase family protein [Actinoplanes atraurantiacus]SNY62263.1 creatinine amidohydrolase [Actinoplanes atraurantiacus]
MKLLPTTTSNDEGRRTAPVAVLPIGSFEQHGDYLPLATDTVIACAIAERLAATYDLLLLPPVTISCSHEHSAWPGTVSIRHTTLTAIVTDVLASLRRSGISRLALVNGHGGNYVLSNVVQEANVTEPVMTLFPARDDWTSARKAAGLTSDDHADMHAGELEVSVLRYVAPELIREGVATSDHLADDRRLLLVRGMAGYTQTGVIGVPSAGSADKGRLVLDSLVGAFKEHLDALTVSR